MKYLSAHDLAWYWYCDVQAILRARERQKLYEEQMSKHLAYYQAVIDKDIPSTGVFPELDIPTVSKHKFQWEFLRAPYFVLAQVEELQKNWLMLKVPECSEVTKRLYLMQAHVCGWLYNRAGIVLRCGMSEIREETKVDKVQSTLDLYTKLDQGVSEPFRTKMAWKCTSCRYVEPCKVFEGVA